MMRSDLLKLSQLVEENPDRDWSELGDVNVIHWHDFLLFNYTRRCQYKPPQEWNWLEKISRGLIYKRDGEVMAVPFQKFWNWGQIEADGPIVEVSEKLDGSLGIMFWDGSNNRIATRGSFESEQALWATDFLHRRYPALAKNHISDTLLFEIIYPANRIIVDYGNIEDLVLIGAVDTESGEDYLLKDVARWAEGFNLALVLSQEPLPDPSLAATTVLRWAKDIKGTEQEGWVVRTQNGQRLKIKGEEYLKYHHFISGFSKEMVIRSIVVDRNFAEIHDTVCPSYLQDQMQQWADEYIAEESSALNEILVLIQSCPHSERKLQALWIKEQCSDRRDLQTLFFAFLDGKSFTEWFSKIYYGISKQSSKSAAAKADPESGKLPPVAE